MMPLWLLAAARAIWRPIAGVFANEHVRRGAILALGFAALLAVAYCRGRDAGDLQQERARAEQVQREATASANAADARVADVQRDAREREELEDAIDDSNGAYNRERACVILRQQGRDAGITACRRPDD